MTQLARLCLVVLLTLASALPGSAQTRTEGCSKTDQVMAIEAVAGAKTLALGASTAIAEDARFDRWFGKYLPERAETARAAYKAIYEAIRTGRVVVICEPRHSADCEGDTYAFVYSDEPYFVHLCRPFFDQPPMAALRPMADDSLNGSREGTIIHEMSHFYVVAGTEDNCYSRTDCSEMARSDSGAVIENADSYQYFAEDAAFFGGKAGAKAAMAAAAAPPDEGK